MIINTHRMFGTPLHTVDSLVDRTIKTINVPGNISSLRDGLFYNCTFLTNITLPNILKTIGLNTFYNCSNLTTITLPINLISIAANAFTKCDKLINIQCAFDSNSSANTNSPWGAANATITYLAS